MPDALGSLLLRSAAGSIAVKVCNAAAVFAVAVVLARSLGPEEFGVYSYVFALVSLLAIFARAGLPELLVREVARNRFDKNWPVIRSLLIFATRGGWLTSTVLVVLAAVGISLFEQELDAPVIAAYGAALALIPVLVHSELRSGAIRGWGHTVVGQLPTIMLRPALLLLFLVIAILSGKTLTAASAMLLHLVAAALALAFGLAWSHVCFSGLPKAAHDAARSRSLIRQALPFTLLAGALVLDSNIDLLMLGWLANDVDVGLYRAATQTVVVVKFAAASLNVVIAPQITRLYRSGDIDGLQNIITLGSRMIAVAGLPLAALLILFGEEFLGAVFGLGYRAAAPSLAILCVGQSVNLLMGFNGTVMSMTDHASTTAWVIGAGTILNVVLNATLIPLYGITGAALATAVSFAAWNVALAVAAYRRLRIRTTAFGL